MQRIFLLLSLSFGVVLVSICQTTTIVNLPLFADGKTYNELIVQDRILDEVTHEKNLLFLRVQLEHDTIGEYYRYEDDSFVFRKKHQGSILEEGMLQMNMDDHVFSDTATLFDPVTYEPEVYVYFVREPLKQGQWTEEDVLGNSANGNYVDGARSGLWQMDKSGVRSLVRYEEGVVFGVPFPSKTEVLRHLDWLFDNDYQWCNQISHYLKSEPSPYKRTWRLNVEGTNEDCLDLGVFNFQEDGTFIYTEINAGIEDRKRQEGIGTWALEQKNEKVRLLLTFSGGHTDELTFTYFGKDHMEWVWEREE